MAESNEIIAIFKADIEQFKAQMDALGIKVGKLEKGVEDTTQKTKKGFDDSAKSVKKTKDEVSGLEKQFNTLGQRIIAAFAIERVIAFGKAALDSFREAEKAASQLSFAVKNIAGGGIDLFKKLQKQAEQFQKISIFSDEQITNAQTALIQFGLTGTQVEKLIPQILDLASAQGIDLATATDKVIQGISGQTRGLKDAGIAFEDTGSKTENLALLTDKLTKFQGASAAALNTSAGAAKNLENRFDDLLEKVGQLIDQGINELKEEVVSLADFFTLGLDDAAGAKAERILIQFMEKRNKLVLEEVAKGDNVLRLQQIAASSKRGADLIKHLNSTNEETRKAAKIKIDSERQLQKELRQIGQETNTIKDDLTIKGQNDLDQANKERLKKEKELSDEEIKLRIETIRALNKADAEFDESKLKQIEEDKKKLLEEQEELAKLTIANDEATREMFAKDKKDKKEQEEKDRKERIEREQMMLDEIFKAYENQFERRQELLEEEKTAQEKAIDVQRELASKGLSNTLAFEEKRLAELQRQQQKEKEQAKRVKLLETFLNSLAEFSKEDPKTALNKALLQVALATAASAVFAEEGGIIGEIGERSNLSRRHQSGRDVLLHAEMGEGIIPKKSMDVLGKRNFELIRNLHKNKLTDGLMPELPRFTGAIQNPLIATEQIVNELQGVKKEIKNIKTTYIDFEKYHNGLKMMIEEKEAGNKTTTIKNLRKLG